MHPATPLDRVAIIGVGLIGASVGLGLANAGVRERIGFDADAGTAEAALRAGAISRTAKTLEAAVHGADLVVLAAPLSEVMRMLPVVARTIPGSCVVTDVCGVKTQLVEEGERHLGGRFVGGHPMTGSEKSGPASASAELFRGAPWIVTPTDLTRSESLETLHVLVAALDAEMVRMPPREHDRLVAALSHLPHIAAYALADVVCGTHPGWSRLCGGSLRDGTRVAQSSPEMWADLLLANRSEVAPAVRELAQWLLGAADALDSGDRLELMHALARAHRSRTTD